MNGTVEDALAWFESEHRNIAGLAARFEGDTGAAAGQELEKLVTAVSDFYVVRGMWQEWKRLLEPAIASAHGRGDIAREANLRNSLGTVFRRLNDTERARTEIERALQMAEEGNASEVVPAALASLAGIEKRDRRPDRAVPLLERALALYREEGNRRGEAQALGDLASALDELGRPLHALELHQQASALFRELDDRYSAMKELGNTGIAFLNLGRWEEAEAALREVRASSQAFGARRDQVAASRDLALALAGQGRSNEAKEAISEALDRVTELENPYEEALVMQQQAHVLARIGETLEAEAALRRSAERLEEAGLTGAAAYARSELGAFCMAHDKESAAEPEFMRAIDLSVAKDNVAALRAHYGLGVIAINEGRLEDAVAYAEFAAEGFREQDRIRDLREALRLQGTALYQLGRVEESETVAQEMQRLPPPEQYES